MSLAAEHGYLNQDAAGEAIGRRIRDLVRCYGEAAEAQRFAGGRVALHFVVDLQGRSKSVHVTESQLGNHEVEQCLLGVARGIAFSQPQGGEATVDYSLEFRSTGEISVVDVAADEALPAMPSLLRQLAADCQRLGSEEVLATLYVSSAGAVRSVGFAGSAPMDADSMACAARTFRGWNAPMRSIGPVGLGRVTISLRNTDVANPPPAPATPARRQPSRLAQKRRGR